MARNVELSVDLIACTHFTQPSDVAWTTDATGGQALIEFAGRACYESFDKPNPHTADNASYLRHVMEVGHTALLEHATATLYLRGLSRAASHEFVRHRHFSFSELSQRYVDPEELNVVIPRLIADDEALLRLYHRAMDESRFAFDELLAALEEKLGAQANGILRNKQARQAARSVLPNSTETRIVVTGNFRTWRHFLAMRATEHADAEIRTVAVKCLKVLQPLAPVVFGDFEIATLSDGSEMATSPYVTDF
ncbi:FAD-dependent thymidylate synthase [Corynebacterium epidermidicanis]|uniref:Flavin-dependent thymidylate synthase n=1 Tax=Corynebacterium epidermidicanis TaxID=1050174 RepID=A0A0G3GV03_9CORY|nr:FAD-dependent thymidylate synthase [Corynebacterium epidermidicanis]AKK03363.1 thymidylate synthase (FAD) [Corynebacterium epidermidicanis]